MKKEKSFYSWKESIIIVDNKTKKNITIYIWTSINKKQTNWIEKRICFSPFCTTDDEKNIKSPVATTCFLKGWTEKATNLFVMKI